MKTTAWAMLIGFMVLLATMLVPEQRAYACSCAAGSAAEKLELFDAVFTGTVVGVGGRKRFVHDTSRKYTFEVDTAWKGIAEARATVYSFDTGEASCGYSFSRGKTYLVFAYEEEGNWKTNLCAGNLQINEAASAIALLGDGTKIEKTGGANLFQNGTLSTWAGPATGAAALLILIALLWSWRRNNR